jgi:hypothetical protein
MTPDEAMEKKKRLIEATFNEWYIRKLETLLSNAQDIDTMKVNPEALLEEVVGEIESINA